MNAAQVQAATIDALNVRANLAASHGHLAHFVGTVLPRELRELERREPKTEVKRAEWTARVAGYRAVLA